MFFWLIHSDKKDAKDKEEADIRRQGNRKSKLPPVFFTCAP